MKKLLFLLISVLALSVLTFAQDPGWPRQLTNNGNVLVLYTPQVEDWPQYQTLNFRMAFQITPYQGKLEVGVLYLTAATKIGRAHV